MNIAVPLRHKRCVCVAVAVILTASIAACGGGSGGAVFQPGNPGGESAPPVGPGGESAGPVAELRKSTALDKLDWRFVQSDTLTDEQALSADASSWASVTLPHSWNAKDAASEEQTTPATANYKRGKGWYRLDFVGAASVAATVATQWLQFDGASIVADVWLNGEKLGQHRGAFTRFRFDVTGKLKPGGNTLVVKADNSAPTKGSDITAIIPLSGDFNMAGGLYRGVSTANKAHFALDDLGASGIYASTNSISGPSAVIQVRAKLKNDGAADGRFVVRASLLDASGQTTQTSQVPVDVKAGQRSEATQTLNVGNARLWNGIADPYLYKLVVQLENGSGDVVDRVIQDYGIRNFRFDPDKGFFLNGKSFPLHGVNLHQDYLGMAWAIDRAQTDESLALIKDIGANTVRLAHYPHAQYTLAQTDKMGFVAWAENPFVNATVVPCAPGIATDPSLVENAKVQLQELIRQQYNHASIAAWSVGNETSQGCGLPANAVPLLKELHKLARIEDPSRPSTLASNKDNDLIGGITDTWALNKYNMWYDTQPVSSLSVLFDQARAQYPNQAMGVSEYGAGGALTHQSDNPNDGNGAVMSGDPSGKTRIVYQPESYASIAHEQNYGMFLTKAYLWGTYVWNMFDFGSGIRHEGDIGATNTKGLVSFDRKTKKDAFFYYKAHWSKEPVTYITQRRYVERNLPTANVKIYSNADAVTLSANGRAVKTLAAADCPNRTCNFGEIPLVVGDNRIVATGTVGGQSISDTVVWKLDADHADNLYIAAGQITTGFYSEANGALGVAKRFGSDNYYAGGVRRFLPAGTGPGQWSGPLVNVGRNDVPPEGRVWDMYREEATGGFLYNLALAPGKSYQVTLGFMEPRLGAGQRVFDVKATANGATTTPIAGLDVAASAGGTGRALVRRFPVTVGADGKLQLQFIGSTGKAVVSNIMVVQQ